jgi:hypothetical protein
LVNPRHKRQQVSAGVTRTDHFWGFYLQGTRRALVQSGLADAHWFSDLTERNTRGTTVRQKRFTVYGRTITTYSPSRGQCTIEVNRRTEERDQRDDPSAWREFLQARSVQDAAFHQITQPAWTKPKCDPSSPAKTTSRNSWAGLVLSVNKLQSG